VDFDWDAAAANIQAVRPGMETVRVSAKTGDGMPEFIALLDSRLAELRGMAVS
jgi:Ni2+-binding GTPase involved in maturation of urease and hydrogenase